MLQQHHRSSLGRDRPRGRSWLTPRLLLSSLLTAALLALSLLGLHQATSPHGPRARAAGAVNTACTLIPPANMLTAAGLATPYQLVASDPAAGPCNEANPQQSAFVQAAVFDPATHTISVYNPLVVDQGTQPAIAPVKPAIPQGAIVAVWFGFNGTLLTLGDPNGTLAASQCVTGVTGSPFGQFAYCNAAAFFQAATAAVGAGTLTPPPLGTAKDGQPCPTVRDFSIVDQDQSDNLTTIYIALPNGQTAQDTTANVTALQNQNAQLLLNGSDNRLLTLVDSALGCRPWMAPDLANPGGMLPTLALNELQAAALQGSPVALVPNLDPMALVGGSQLSLAKVNAYRAGVDQPASPSQQASNTTAYCQHLAAIAPGRLLLDAQMGLTVGQPSPDPALGLDLFTFLAQRFATTFNQGGLNCAGLLGETSPISLAFDGNGVTIAAVINGTTVHGVSPGGVGTPTATPAAIDCLINGTVLVGCRGTATLGGQTCTFSLDAAMRQVIITC